MVENLDGLQVEKYNHKMEKCEKSMRNLFLIVFLLNVVFSQIPETLKGQQNKSIKDIQNEFTDIHKSNLSFVYSQKGDMIISVNIDQKNRLISKTYYDRGSLIQTYVNNENCKNIDCEYYIHYKNKSLK